MTEDATPESGEVLGATDYSQATLPTRVIITLDGVGYELEDACEEDGKYATRLSTGAREFLTFEQLNHARWYGRQGQK